MTTSKRVILFTALLALLLSSCSKKSSRSSPETGIITVTTNLSNASFAIVGPVTYQGSGTYWTRSDAPPGVYTITYASVNGYITPPSQTDTLAVGGSISFSADYEQMPNLICLAFGEFNSQQPWFAIACSRTQPLPTVSITGEGRHVVGYFSGGCVNLGVTDEGASISINQPQYNGCHTRGTASTTVSGQRSYHFVYDLVDPKWPDCGEVDSLRVVGSGPSLGVTSTFSNYKRSASELTGYDETRTYTASGHTYYVRVRNIVYGRDTYYRIKSFDVHVSGALVDSCTYSRQ